MRSIADVILALGSVARCERPSAASFRRAGVQPSGFFVGPDEKWGDNGLRSGNERIGNMANLFSNVTIRWGIATRSRK